VRFPARADQRAQAKAQEDEAEWTDSDSDEEGSRPEADSFTEWRAEAPLLAPMDRRPELFATRQIYGVSDLGM
jgi:hypothetical protein